MSVCGGGVSCTMCVCVRALPDVQTTDQTTREVFQLESVSVHKDRSGLALEKGEKLFDRQC